MADGHPGGRGPSCRRRSTTPHPMRTRSFAIALGMDLEIMSEVRRRGTAGAHRGCAASSTSRWCPPCSSVCWELPADVRSPLRSVVAEGGRARRGAVPTGSQARHDRLARADRARVLRWFRDRCLASRARQRGVAGPSRARSGRRGPVTPRIAGSSTRWGIAGSRPEKSVNIYIQTVRLLARLHLHGQRREAPRHRGGRVRQRSATSGASTRTASSTSRTGATTWS